MITRIHSKFPKFVRKKTMVDFKCSLIEILIFVLEPLFKGSITLFECETISVGGIPTPILDGMGDVVRRVLT